MGKSQLEFGNLGFMNTGSPGEALGFTYFYGWSPAIDFLIDPSLKSKKNVSVLLNNTTDIRHVIKTLADNANSYKDIENLEIYILENYKECFARDMILLEIINNANESYRERIELFYDIYWNCFIREKTCWYIENKIKELQNAVSDYDKSKLVTKSIYNFKELKFKDRDDLVDIFKSWSSKTEFNMEDARDRRLRYHYKERYDYRSNLIDWDYVWNMKPDFGVIHYREYKDWRQNGNAFETRFSTYIKSNKTMSSYIEGNRKFKDQTHLAGERCMVRGFWGDIVNSPFLSFGVDCDVEPDKSELFKTRNYNYEFLSMHIAEYNLHNYIMRLETFENYHIDFQKGRKEAEKKFDEEQAKKRKTKSSKKSKKKMKMTRLVPKPKNQR